MDTSKTKPQRKPYHKPAVQEVRLRVNEAVLGTDCKNASTSNSNQGDICVTIPDFQPCIDL